MLVSAGIDRRIEAVQGDITRAPADAVVNAANPSLLGGGGVDGAIHRAAGPGLLAACRTLGGCPTGAARITGGHNLPARHVIHTVGPVYSGTAEDAVTLAGCYRACITLAAEADVRCLAFPAISCGAYGYPITEAVRIAVDTTRAALADTPLPERVLFVLYSPADHRVYSEYLDGLRAS